MQNLIGVILVGFLAASLLSSNAMGQLQDGEFKWKLKRDRNDIQIYLSKVPESKFRAILSVMRVKSEPRQLAALLMDLDNCSRWVAMCRKAELIERVSPTEVFIYSRNDAPFPVRDRDIVAHVNWQYDTDSGKVSMMSRAVEGKRAKTKGVIRVKAASSEWHFTPMEGGVVLVENYAHVDPNGAVPAWLTNMLLVDSPYKTMKQMRSQIESGKYDTVEVSFIPKKSQGS